MNKAIEREAGQAPALNQDQLCVSILDFELLKAAASGHIDLNALAKKHMENCGLDNDGVWIGFAAAKTFWRGKY